MPMTPLFLEGEATNVEVGCFAWVFFAGRGDFAIAAGDFMPKPPRWSFLRTWRAARAQSGSSWRRWIPRLAEVGFLAFWRRVFSLFWSHKHTSIVSGFVSITIATKTRSRVFVSL